MTVQLLQKLSITPREPAGQRGEAGEAGRESGGGLQGETLPAGAREQTRDNNNQSGDHDVEHDVGHGGGHDDEKTTAEHNLAPTPSTVTITNGA